MSDHLQAVLFAALEVGEFGGGGAPAGEGFGDRGWVEIGKAVKEDALLGLVEAGEGFALRVDEGELGGEQLEHADGGRLVVDEDSAFAGDEDFRGGG